MKKITLFFIALLFFSISSVAQDKWHVFKVDDWVDQVNYGEYNDKLFFTGKANGPVFTFNSFPNKELDKPDCMFGDKFHDCWFRYHLSAPSKNQIFGYGDPVNYQPKLEDVGHRVTLAHHRRDHFTHSCDNGPSTNEWVYKTAILTVEFPHWTSKKDELKNICNDYGTINVFDFFSFNAENTAITTNNGLTFFIDDKILTSHLLNINELSPGFHTLKASKKYDNGNFEEAFKFSIRPSPKITFGEYTNPICQNWPTRTIHAFSDGKSVSGLWSGEGIDQNGNFSPANAGAGLKKLSYSYTNTAGCFAKSDIFIEVLPLSDAPIITGNFKGCVGDVVTLSASSGDIKEFAWYIDGDHAPFFIGKKLVYTITVTTIR